MYSLVLLTWWVANLYGFLWSSYHRIAQGYILELLQLGYWEMCHNGLTSWHHTGQFVVFGGFLVQVMGYHIPLCSCILLEPQVIATLQLQDNKL